MESLKIPYTITLPHKILCVNTHVDSFKREREKNKHPWSRLYHKVTPAGLFNDMRDLILTFKNQGL